MTEGKKPPFPVRILPFNHLQFVASGFANRLARLTGKDNCGFVRLTFPW